MEVIVASHVSLSTKPNALLRTTPPKAFLAVKLTMMRCWPALLTGVIRVSRVSMLSGSLSLALISSVMPP